MDDVVKRMEKIKNRLEEVKTEKSRLTGEIQAKKQQLEELEKKCREQFGVEPDELPSLLEKKLAKVEENQKKIEKALGI